MKKLTKFYIESTLNGITVHERYIDVYGLLKSWLLGYFDSEKEAKQYVRQCNKQYGKYL